ncbi:DUF551 domain-containing protein [uncultured Roseibium sp.]|uniref:DUF551 domain-containing protein n=1 Tax=uncultured Roseibium sp. TaxID=1936171 RepID=UPI00261F66F7|nr:DUF551 domain-containing protein [uncultured Roseibium sp.]
MDWRTDMENAPIEEKVLVMHHSDNHWRGKVVIAYHHSDYNGHGRRFTENGQAGWVIDSMPSHWMPLPAPPSKQ